MGAAEGQLVFALIAILLSLAWNTVRRTRYQVTAATLTLGGVAVVLSMSMWPKR